MTRMIVPAPNATSNWTAVDMPFRLFQLVDCTSKDCCIADIGFLEASVFPRASKTTVKKREHKD